MNKRRTFSAAILAVAVAATMAFAAAASATTLTSPAGTTYTSTIEGTSTDLRLHGAFVTVECGHYAFAGTIQAHGLSTTASGSVSKMTFQNCNFQKTVKKTGTLAIHSNGALASSGAEIEVHTSVGRCTYTTNNTTMGTLTSSSGGINAVVDIKATVPRTGGNFLCGSSSQWTGTATITTPSTLVVD